MIPVLKAGCKAYYDSFAGPVPCKVLSIRSEPIDWATPEVKVLRAQCEVTEAVGSYKKGEGLRMPTQWVFPKEALGFRGHQYVIKPYTVEVDHDVTN